MRSLGRGGQDCPEWAGPQRLCPPSGLGRLQRAGGGSPPGSRSPCRLRGAALAPPRRRRPRGPAAVPQAERVAAAVAGRLPRAAARPPARPPVGPGSGSARPSSPLPPSPARAARPGPARGLSRKVWWFFSAPRRQRRRAPRPPNFGAHSHHERPSAAAAAQSAAARRGRRGRRRGRAGPRLRARALPGAWGCPGGGHLVPSADRLEPRAGAAPAGLLWRLQPGARPGDGLLHRGPEGKVLRVRQLCSRPCPRHTAWLWPGCMP